MLEKKHLASQDSIDYLIERIISNAEHLSSMVDNLLLLAQTDEENIGKITLTSVKLQESVQTVLDAQNKSVQFVIPEDDISVMAYRVWLEEILNTFINIAEQHALDAETLKIEIETEQTDRHVRLWLEYQGEEMTSPTSRVQFLLAQRLAAHMNCQVNIDRLKVDRWELSLKLPRF